MSLASSLNKFRSELADTTTRNIQHSRPSTLSGAAGPARSSTPRPGESNSKRTHETAFTSTTTTSGGHSGSEILTQVVNAVKYLKEKDSKPVTFDNLIGYLSLPNDAQKNIPFIRRALRENERVEFIPKTEAASGKESFKYRPLHPVTNVEELREYLATLPPAQGIPVKELRDGFPDCFPAIRVLETEGRLLCVRNKKDNTPRTIYADSPSYHILSSTSSTTDSHPNVMKVDPDFADIWSKTKIPASEVEIRTELERAGLTPTSQVKDTGGLGRGGGKKERKRAVRRGGKQTNQHMLGILKDYSRK